MEAEEPEPTRGGSSCVPAPSVKGRDALAGRWPTVPGARGHQDTVYKQPDRQTASCSHSLPRPSPPPPPRAQGSSAC